MDTPVRYWALLLLCTGLLAGGCGGSSSPSGSVKTGEDGQLRHGGESKIMIAVDEDSYEALLRASRAKDYIGVHSLVGRGLVFEVAPGTTVRMLAPGFRRSQVRVMEGEHFGRSGFVPAEWVKR